MISSLLLINLIIVGVAVWFIIVNYFNYCGRGKLT